jgi:hypothetical protein
MRNSSGVYCKDVLISRSDDAFAYSGCILNSLLRENVCESQEDLLGWYISGLTRNKVWNTVITVSRPWGYGLKPQFAISDKNVKLRTFPAVTPQIEPMFKECHSKVHLPKPLKKMIACILKKMTVSERSESRPELFNEMFVGHGAGMISRGLISRILTRAIHEERHESGRHKS